MTPLEILKLLVTRPPACEQRSAPAVEPAPSGEPGLVFLGELVTARIAIAAHEVAHAIVATVLDAPVVRVVLHDDGSGACFHEEARNERDAALISLAGIEAERGTFFRAIEPEADEPDEQRVRHLSRNTLASLRFALLRFLADRRVQQASDELAALLLVEHELDAETVESVVEASGARGAASILRGK